MKQNYIIILFILLLMPFSICHDMRTFYFNGINTVLFYIFIKILFSVLIYVLGKQLTKSVQEVLEHKQLKKRIIFSAIIFYCLLVGLILIWPGNWVEVDEYSIYQYAKNMSAHPNQGLFISVLYIMGLMLWNNPGAILILQIFIVSFIWGRIISDLYEKIKNKITVIILMLLCFSLPCLYYTYQPMRTCLFAMLLMLFIHNYLQLWEKEDLKHKDIINLTLLLSLIVCIRSEIKFMIVFYPIMIICIKIKNGIFSQKKICTNLFIIIVSIFLYSTVGKIGGAGGSPFIYSLITPIYTVLTDENIDMLKIKNELENIDKVVPIEEIMQKSDMAVSFAVPRADYTQIEYKQFLKSTASLIAKYPHDLFKCKIYALGISLGCMKDWTYIQTVDNVQNWDTSLVPSELHPLNMEVQSIISNMLGAQFYIGNMHMYNFFWALWIPCILTLIVFGVSIIKRKSCFFLVSCILIIQLILTALTAPAHYAMYYFPNYVCGWYLFIRLIMLKRAKQN